MKPPYYVQARGRKWLKAWDAKQKLPCVSFLLSGKGGGVMGVGVEILRIGTPN